MHLDLGRRGLHLHAGLALTHAGGRERARAHIDHTHAADTNGLHPRVVAERGDVDAVLARGVPDARALGHLDIPTIDFELDHRSAIVRAPLAPCSAAIAAPAVV